MEATRRRNQETKWIRKVRFEGEALVNIVMAVFPSSSCRMISGSWSRLTRCLSVSAAGEVLESRRCCEGEEVVFRRPVWRVTLGIRGGAGS